ncbi:putative efflux pump antibiotic resistance protein [Eutypa lata UCREL1]|uniref:Putative efflux pump antibiotic resistance protein n=1 Tax=Eutypa lata (strain UCR-EL1) TaxID=1287681 RepID=M7SPK3_EUTLA|nr:putative efflux pump antibiotic resistance protein [Eutypa lata UCREL1]
MLVKIHVYDIPALVAGYGMAFGSLMPYFNTQQAILAFGFPSRVADSPGAGSLISIYAVRNSVLGSLILFFYFRRHFRAVDTVLAFTGILTGVVDSYAVWKEGSRKKAASRLGYSWFIGAWGLAGMTAAARRGRY